MLRECPALARADEELRRDRRAYVGCSYCGKPIVAADMARSICAQCDLMLCHQCPKGDACRLLKHLMCTNFHGMQDTRPQCMRPGCINRRHPDHRECWYCKNGQKP